MKRTLAPFCLIAALAAAPASAAVVTLLDNTSSQYDQYGGLGPEGTGVSFTVGSTSYTLKNFTFVLVNPFFSQGSENVTVELFVDTSSGAGGTYPNLGSSPQASATVSATLNSPTTINFSPGTGNNWVVSANSNYALVFRHSGSEFSHLSTTDSNPSISITGGGLNYYGYFFAFDSNVLPTTTGIQPWIELTGEPVVGSSSVPDAGPGPALALLLGGLGLQQWRRSRRTGAAA